MKKNSTFWNFPKKIFKTAFSYVTGPNKKIARHLGVVLSYVYVDFILVGIM
jgi:hypothetical protein